MRMAFIGILLGMSASIMMQTILATVLPQVVRELGGGELYSWVFSGYMVASTVTIPIFAKLADLYGRKRFYLGGMLVFLIGSALSGTADSMTELVIYRALQGLGAGAIAPAAIAIISDLFPIEQRGKMLGILAVIQVLANLAGPLLGGYITDNFGWQWSFFAVLPVGILASIFVERGLPELLKISRTSDFAKIDWAGGLLLGIGTTMFIQALRSSVDWQGKQLLTLLLFGLAGMIFMAFFRQEKSHPDPVVSLDLIETQNVLVSLVSAFLLGAVMYGAIAVLPIYGQALWGGTSLQGGKLLLLFTLGTGLGGIVSGKLTQKFSYARLAVGGWTVVTMGFALLTFTSRIDDVSNLLIALLNLISGFGLGITIALFLLPAQNSVTENRRSVAAGLVQLSRNLGGAIGIPLITGLLTATGGLDQTTGTTGNFFIIFLVLALLSALGAIIGNRFKGSVIIDRENSRIKSFKNT